MTTVQTLIALLSGDMAITYLVTAGDGSKLYRMTGQHA